MKVSIMTRMRNQLKRLKCDFPRHKKHHEIGKNQKPSDDFTTTIVESHNSSLDEKNAAPYAIIYKSELDYISRCILDYKNIETGGQLFGFWTTEGVPVILYAIGPGPNANHQRAFFVQDLDFLSRIGHKIISGFGLQHIGEWHSHHQLGLAQPSGHDASTIVKAMQRYGKRRCLLCIGNCDNHSSTVNAFNFHENDFSRYTRAAWEVKSIESPFRRIIDDALGTELIHPRTEQACHGQLNIVHQEPSHQQNRTTAPQRTPEYWFNDRSNHIVLKHIIDYLHQLYYPIRPNVKQDDSGLIHVLIQGDKTIDICFPQQFPAKAPVVTIEEYIELQTTYNEHMPAWNFDGDIYTTFVNFYTKKI